MVRAGEEYQHKTVKVKIVEVLPYTTFSGRKEIMIGYRIIDGNYVSPVAHFWMGEFEDIREKIANIVEYYLQVKGSVIP